jgi:hypothetical protein
MAWSWVWLFFSGGMEAAFFHGTTLEPDFALCKHSTGLGSSVPLVWLTAFALCGTGDNKAMSSMDGLGRIPCQPGLAYLWYEVEAAVWSWVMDIIIGTSDMWAGSFCSPRWPCVTA